MKIRAKFRCTSVTRHDPGPRGNTPSEEITMVPVTSGSKENKEWSEYTPSGSLNMLITEKGAVGVFQPGYEYFLEISRAEYERDGD